MKEKICLNCGTRMIWNGLLGRWECNLCGNVIELNPKPFDRLSPYIN